MTRTQKFTLSIIAIFLCASISDATTASFISNALYANNSHIALSLLVLFFGILSTALTQKPLVLLTGFSCSALSYLAPALINLAHATAP